MENYNLQENEVVLFSDENVSSSVVPKGKAQLILTNLFLVYIFKTKQGFRKYITNIEKVSMDTLKVYNDKPQVKQHSCIVELFFIDGEHKITFDSFFSAKKFVKQVNELISGKSVVRRSADKVKSGIGLVDETLGLDTVDTVKSVLQNGVVGTVISGIGHNRPNSKKKQLAGDVFGAIAEQADIISTESSDNSSQQGKTLLTIDEQVKAVQKLKSLLDQGILTQEEFENKKREIMGL